MSYGYIGNCVVQYWTVSEEHVINKPDQTSYA